MLTEAKPYINYEWVWDTSSDGYPLVLDSETITGVHTETKKLTRTTDGLNRSTGYELGTSGNTDQDMKVEYSYVSNDGRLQQISSTSYETDSDAFTYTYGTAGQLAPTLLEGENVGDDPYMSTTFNYMSDVDVLNYLENKVDPPVGSIVTVSKYDYDYNGLGLRTTKTLSGSAFSSTTYDEYDYNSKHEMTEAIRYESGTPLTDKEFYYSYDDIGNRLEWYDGSDDSGDLTEYTPTHLHQYSSITGKHAASPIDYDSDGNLIELDGRVFIYDGENRLIEVQDDQTNTLAAFKYDYLGRRVEKTTPSKTETYLYDGWNLIAVYDDGQDHEPLITYTWGLDLSLSMQGAGGVGGLLMSCERSGSAWTYFHDGHGNVSQVIDQSDGSTTVALEYDPYGNVISGSPGTGLRDAFRFSSKFYDVETGLYYYGYRYYDPEHGRWLNRDPIAEVGGVNLYAMTQNNPVSIIDAIGLQPPFSIDFPNVPPLWEAIDSGPPLLPPVRLPALDEPSISLPPLPTSPNISGGWYGAISAGIAWVLGWGGGDHPTYYGPDSPQVDDLKRSEIAQQLRLGFLDTNTNHVCEEWVDYTNVILKWSINEVIRDIGNGTAHFVGSARGDAYVTNIDTTNCIVTAKFVLTNPTSLKSGLYRLWPESLNITHPHAPCSNWTQLYEWSESFKCDNDRDPSN